QECLEKALAMAEAEHLPTKEKLPILERLRDCLMKLNDYPKLEPILEQDLKMSSWQGSKLQRCRLMSMLTWCNYNLHNGEKAMFYAEQLMPLVLERYGKKSLDYARALQSLGSCQMLNGDYDKANKTLRQALEAEGNAEGSRILTLMEIALAEAEQGHYAE